MKNYLLIALGITLLASQAGCNNTSKQKTGNAVTVSINPQDTLRTYLQVYKMAAKVFQMQQQGQYDSSLAGYNRCLDYLTGALAATHNKGISIYETGLTGINERKEAIYDSLKQPENAVACALECVKWAKKANDYTMQIKYDLHVADKYKNMASQSINDTAKAGMFLRQALLYSIACVRAIDSLRNNDMDDVKYEGFHLTSKIYAQMGDKKQAQLYDKKYRDVYYSIFKAQPADK